jgi:hypothetical protein
MRPPRRSLRPFDRGGEAPTPPNPLRGDGGRYDELTRFMLNRPGILGIYRNRKSKFDPLHVKGDD